MTALTCSMKQQFRLVHTQARQRAVQAIIQAPDGYHVIVREATRTLDQNARMWAMLTDVSEQVAWHGQHLTPEEWKDVFTAALKRQKVVPGLDGGFVVIGARTSSMTKSDLSDLMELMAAFGAEREVRFGDDAR